MSDVSAAVRAAARALRGRLDPSNTLTPTDLVEVAFRSADVDIKMFPRGRKFGASVNARLERDASIVWVADDMPPDVRTAVLAHELGHFHLHDDPVYEDRAGDRRNDADRLEVEGYSPRELKERQADAFSAEFLCPARELRAALTQSPASLDGLAATFGLPLNVLAEQVLNAMLEDSPHAAGCRAPLPVVTDDEGERVFFHGGGGSGKTTRLLARAVRHLDTKKGPATLMMLTARDEAATWLRRRLIDLRSDGHGVWVGSVRALATEIVAKWPEATGRSPAFRVVENTAAVKLLTNVLTQSAQGGAYPWKTAATRFRELADAYRSGVIPSAWPALNGPEGGAWFRAYEMALVSADYFDVPSLVPWATTIVRTDARAREGMQSRFRHVLVDDVEDLTSAELDLVRHVFSGETRLTAAGNPGRSIRGFAGAARAGVEEISTILSVAPRPLDGNRRAAAAIAGAADDFARLVSVGPAPHDTSIRPISSDIPYFSASCPSDETAVLTERIRADAADGIPYRDQVVIARTHDKLRRTSAGLVARGIPVKFLGEMASRPEVSALLDWLRLTIDGDAAAFRRIAARPPYELKPRSVAGCVAILSDWKHPPDVRLRDIMNLPDPSSPPCSGLTELRSHLACGTQGRGVGQMLLEWLLRSGTLSRTFARGDAPAARLELVAIYVTIRMAGGDIAAPKLTVATLIDRLSRAGAVDQSNAILATALEATSIDAVTVVTVHAASGREFRAAHVVGADAAAFPSKPTGARWPVRHQEERAYEADLAEADVFATAISRSSERLALYSARTDDARRPRVAPASPYLQAIARHLAPRTA